MPRESSRGHKVADLIQRELAILIQREVKDPRLGMVTINEARVSRDLSFADVYFTVLPSDESEAVEEVLNEASGFLRSQLAKILNTRTTPKLRFHYDKTIENGARLSKAIDDALADDASQSARNRSGEEQ
ncbi:MAG: 30S ribosome-binding factor RbfA [Pseudomonadales bacterium]|nr:30S ribosome-binding factor RbfA [Pseudomonadales bacterium]MBO6564022.1 30S ribosome-binding factor RbfA [Pseudomonadales bacterium]MBO6597464.1 30S ribosome-binding factor RbfA [Pseudomonadales bacterium]MBO6703041.1 30S ribosome-binding factor RbfA [Pseudomonadales bacterium]MBO6824198.1 30S ribosome-binding factor RbfA [Pseudomonadales bacterium]